jgi:TolB protein
MRRPANGAVVALVVLVGVALLTVSERTAQSQSASPALAARSSLPAAAATSKIAFISEPPGGGYCGVVYVMNADGSGQRRLTNGAADPVARGCGGETDPAWSPDGRKIAFVSVVSRPTIYVMNADGSGQRKLTRNSARCPNTCPSAGRDSNPVWSPDGRRIAFVSKWQVYVMNADGSGQRRLTRNGARNFAPAWSPDGQRIAFERRVGREKYGRCDGCGRAVTFQVYVMNADGSEARMLAQDAARPVWSPDGQKIAFEMHPHGMAFERQSDIYVMNADGSGQRNLTRGAGRRESAPVWSPALKK